MSTAKELLEQRDKILDEYEKNLGLPVYVAEGDSNELNLYLSMNRDAIEKLSGDTCMAIAARLVQFSFHIQRAQNREMARISWAKNEIRMSIAKELQSYSGYGYEEKSSQAIKGNDHANKVNQILIYAQQRADRLNFLATGLKNLSDVFKSIFFNKRQNSE